jgi:pSer/pThr/pTyr-binding forkhead associated (FHA) protein
MPYLIYRAGEEKEAFQMDAPSEISVGRTSENDIRIMNDSSVSRKHCLISISSDMAARVKDLGSSNGTKLNGIDIEQTPKHIGDGGIIGIGDAKFIYCVDNPEKFIDADLKPVRLRVKGQEEHEEEDTPADEKDAHDTLKINRKDISPEQNNPIPEGSFDIDKGAELEGYRVIRNLGEGPFSKTFLAHQKSVDRTIVLKVFTIIQDYSIGEAFDSLKREMSKIGAAEDPAFLSYFDCGAHLRHCFLAMPYLSEGTLKDGLLRKTKYSEQEALELILYLVKALQSAEKTSQTGHLSINPSNIMFNDIGNAILADYGIRNWKRKFCKKNDAFNAWTRYEAPEFANESGGDFISDIYSLGVILCDMLSGLPPAEERQFNRDASLKSCKAGKETLGIIRSATEPARKRRIQSYDVFLKMLQTPIKKITAQSPPPARSKSLQIKPPQKKLVIRIK